MFNMRSFIQDVFAPGKNEMLTIMTDIPHDPGEDTVEWRARRTMAADWRDRITRLSTDWGMRVNPLVTYYATGNHNSGLPDKCVIDAIEMITEDVIRQSTIILSMPEFSATAPLYEYSLSSERLRVGSMPGVAKFMEETGLSADYGEISRKCRSLIDILSGAIGAEVLFSTGHRCYFDLTANRFFGDDGILHPETAGTEKSCSNLPAGEVYTVPNENPGSLTSGELPFSEDGENGVFVVRENRITDVIGDSDKTAALRHAVLDDPGWQNIAEFAVGVNDKAVVTGNILQDEKAGFHWAFGLSSHLGGSTGEDRFNSPANVVHRDFVYARGNDIECSQLDLIMKDNSRVSLIKEGVLINLPK